MNENLRTQLLSAGWTSGTFRGFLMSRRAGIEFQVGPSRASRSDPQGTEPHLELHYRYITEMTRAEGEEVLVEGAGLREIEDAMTGIYLRVHEKPDVTRVFGARRRSARTSVAPPPRPAEPEPVDPGQGALDF